MAAMGSAVAAAMPSEPVVEEPVCWAPAEEPVVRAPVDEAPPLEEPVESGSLSIEVTDAKSSPRDENSADTLERAEGSRVEKASLRDEAASEATELISLIEPSRAADADARAADWSDGDRVAKEDAIAAVSMSLRDASALDTAASPAASALASSEDWAYVKAAMPTMIAVEKRMLWSVDVVWIGGSDRLLLVIP